MSDLLDAARKEERSLLQRLRAVQRLIVAYGGVPETLPTVEEEKAQPSPRSSSTPPPRRRRSSQGDAVVNEVEQVLKRNDDKPIMTRQLLELLKAQGVEVGGQKPTSTLSAMLSNSERFVSIRGEGWVRKEAASSWTASDSADAEDENGGSEAPAVSEDAADLIDGPG